MRDGYDNVLTGVQAAITEVVGCDASHVLPAVTLLELGAQSFDFLEIVTKLEDQYDVLLPPLYSIPDQRTVDAYVCAVLEALTTCPGDRSC